MVWRDLGVLDPARLVVVLDRDEVSDLRVDVSDLRVEVVSLEPIDLACLEDFWGADDWK